MRECEREILGKTLGEIHADAAQLFAIRLHWQVKRNGSPPPAHIERELYSRTFEGRIPHLQDTVLTQRTMRIAQFVDKVRIGAGFSARRHRDRRYVVDNTAASSILRRIVATISGVPATP